MAGTHGDEDWLYHLPAFLDRVRERSSHDVREGLDVEVGGVLYHHRGARVPAHNATFVWREDVGEGDRGDGEESERENGEEGDRGDGEDATFELELDAVGRRGAWARFDAARDWDFYISRVPGDAPCLIWMTDAEFRAEEADDFASKQEAVGMMRFSFGLYLQSPDAWPEVEERASETDAPCFLYRPSGRTLVPEGDLERYEEVVPPELLDGEEGAPDYLGLEEAYVEGE